MLKLPTYLPNPKEKAPQKSLVASAIHLSGFYRCASLMKTATIISLAMNHWISPTHTYGRGATARSLLQAMESENEVRKISVFENLSRLRNAQSRCQRPEIRRH
jgi:hypothetical protein